jgi:phosphoribosylanthranilate isomerase
MGVDILGIVCEYPAPVLWNLERSEAKALSEKAQRLGAMSSILASGDTAAVAAMAKGIGSDFVQLHGRESPQEAARLAEALAPSIRLIRTVFSDDPRIEETVDALSSSEAYALLLDSRMPEDASKGGKADPSLYRKIAALTKKPVFLAGGINPQNVAGLIAATGAGYIDLMSGVEGVPGTKDPQKVARLMESIGDYSLGSQQP